MMEFSAIHESKRLSNLRGRKEEIESGGLLGLGTRIIVENVHEIRN